MIIPGLKITMSFRVSSGKRSERYVKPNREIDTSTTNDSDRIAFASIAIGDKLEGPDRPEHEGVWEKVI